MNIIVAIAVGANYIDDDITPELNDCILNENLSEYIALEDGFLITIQL
jgi:hypothetical protein